MLSLRTLPALLASFIVSGTSAARSATVGQAASEQCAPIGWFFGDVNGDSRVDIIDAQQTARATVGLSVGNPSLLALQGDANGDGILNIIDAQQLARFTVGLSASSHIGQGRVEVSHDGTLVSSTCTLANADGGRDYTGPEAGSYNFAIFAMSVPANSTLEVNVAPGTLPNYVLLSYTSAGQYVGRAAQGPLVLANTSGTIRQFQVLLTTTTSGAVGSYRLSNRFVYPAACTSFASLTLEAGTDGSVAVSPCALENTTENGSFAGPRGGGSYLYTGYTLDLPAGSMVEVTMANATIPGWRLVAYDEWNNFVSRASQEKLALANISSVTQRFQILATSSNANATGAFTITAHRLAMPPCPSPAVLTLGTLVSTTLASSQCTLITTEAGHPNTGPQPGGAYFFDAYNLEVPANGIVQVAVTPGTLTTYALLAFDSTGAFVARSYTEGLTINNTSASPQRYRLLVTSPRQADVGSYSIVGRQVPEEPCAGPGLNYLGTYTPRLLRASYCTLRDAEGGRPFYGPERGGTYFYDATFVDIPPNTAVRTWADGSSLSSAVILLYDAAGNFIAKAPRSLTFANSTSTQQRYFVVLTTEHAGQTGGYWFGVWRADAPQPTPPD